jgi:thioredoxin reductase
MDGGGAGGSQAGRDPFSIAGKFRPPEQRFDVVVIGAGPAGTKAAIAAAGEGASVLLIDENPVGPGLIGLDVPLFWGGRATNAVQNPGRMQAQLFAANPDLEVAFEAGVEVMLGVSCWGAFVNGPGLGALPEPIVGLADETNSWLVGFKRLIVAAGARDLALSFKGWDQPGVMGAQGLHSLLGRYDAFAGRRLVILGSGDLAVESAILALNHGLQVAGLIEVRDAPQASPKQLARLEALEVPILTGHVPVLATGGIDGVEKLVLRRVDEPEAEAIEIVCDTICQAIGVVPSVELLDVVGAKLAFDGARGGYTPVLDADGQTTIANVYAIGDCAGVAAGQGADLYAKDWMAALIASGDDSVIVCQCEEVTRAQLTGVYHPAYLGPISPGMAKRSIATLAADGPVNQDQIKRLTRACMGPCQARRCREQVALTLAVATDTPVSAIPLAGYRAPVRPLPLQVIADWQEAAEMSADWDVWFGIPAQWIPYADIDTDREAMHIAALGGNMHM